MDQHTNWTASTTTHLLSNECYLRQIQRVIIENEFPEVFTTLCGSAGKMV